MLQRTRIRPFAGIQCRITKRIIVIAKDRGMMILFFSVGNGPEPDAHTARGLSADFQRAKACTSTARILHLAIEQFQSHRNSLQFAL